MKEFVWKIVMFFFAVISFVVLVNTILIWDVRNRLSMIDDENITNVFMGHSHPECVINDSLLPGFKNFGKSGDAYFYTYQKLKMLKNNNVNLKRVYLEYTNNVLFKHFDSATYADNYTRRLKYVFPFLEKEDFQFLLKNNLNGTIKGIINGGKFFVANSNDEIIERIGGYLYLDRFKTDL